MIENVGKHYIIDGLLRVANDYTKKEYKKRVYEVIRIIDGKPLFFEDHFNRFKKSANLIDKSLRVSKEELKESIKRLVSIEGKKNCNVMIISYYNNKDNWYIVYIRKSSYPKKMKYENGVDTSLLKLRRVTPNAKILKLDYKKAVSKKIKEDNVFEVILYNEDGFLTEGSKSNLFFIKEDSVYTAPDSSVLEGVTRKYVLEGLKEIGIKIIKRNILKEELDIFDACFLTGTSIKILPVRTIENIKYNSATNNIYLKLAQNFEKRIDSDVKKYKV